MKRYSSKNAKILRDLMKQLNKAKIFPYGFTRKFAEENNFKLNPVRDALKGIFANIEVQKALIEYAEQITNTKKSEPEKLNYEHLSAIEIVDQKLLPTGFGKIIAEKLNASEEDVYNFIRSQRKGQGYYSKGELILNEIRNIAAYNIELELIHRANEILKVE